MKRSSGDFSMDKQRRVFDDLAKNSYKGIPGVTYVEGNTRSDAFAVVMAMTHGCEPGGLASAHALLNDSEVRSSLKGNVAIVLGNIAAGAKYFEAPTADERKKYRFLEHDMNRVPEDIGDRTRTGNHPYEIDRMLELSPLLRDASLGLDVHSLGQAGDPMVIDTKGHARDLDLLNDSIDVQRRIADIVAHMTGLSINCLVGGLKDGGSKIDRLNKDVPALALEVGPHEDPSTMDFARKLVLSALMASGYLDGKHVERVTEKHLYRTIGNIKFRDMSDVFTRTHSEFGFIPKGEVLFTGNQGPYVMDRDSHTLFGISEAGRRITDPKFLSGERMFLAAPPEIRNVNLREPQFED